MFNSMLKRITNGLTGRTLNHNARSIKMRQATFASAKSLITSYCLKANVTPFAIDELIFSSTW